MQSANSNALDNPIWHALISRQANFAEVSGLARRFPAAVTSLTAFQQPTSASYDSLASLMSAGETAALFLEAPASPPSGWTIKETVPLLQMVHQGDGPRGAAPEIVELNGNDVAEMVALAELTKPGPFGKRTRELGTYLGVRSGARLIAMAGERLKIPGYTEISAVCTHPAHLGSGYASALVAALIGRIRERGEVPFLHVRPQNRRAVELYARLGFAARVTFDLVVLSRP